MGKFCRNCGAQLQFTPVLPAQKVDDPPFTAVVTMNNSSDYKTEVDRVENGKPFEVQPPMQELPPDQVSVNIKIFRDGVLVHEYQSGQLMAAVSVLISGSRDTVVELTREDLPYEQHFTAKAWPVGEYRFSWNFGNGFGEDTTGREESTVSAVYSEFKKYTPRVTLYDLNGKELASHDVTLTLKEKTAESIPQGAGMEGKWAAYEIYYGGGKPDPLHISITLSINGGQFSMTKSGGGGDAWTGAGSVKEYINALGEREFKLVPDTGNQMDDFYFAEYFGLERGGLYLDYSDERDVLYLGTVGAQLRFKRG